MKRWQALALIIGLNIGFNAGYLNAKPINGVNVVTADLDVASNIYLLTDKQVLIKYNAKGDSLRAVSCAQYGTEAMIDASNPLEVMVFFTLTGKVVVYDNQLNTISETEIFENNPSLLPSAFGRSSDGNIWLLDKSTRTLKKFDKQGKVIQESMQLMEYRFSDTINRICDQGTLVLLSDGQNYLWQYGQSLSLIKKIKKKHTRLLGFSGNTYVFVNKENTVVRYNLKEDKEAGKAASPGAIIYAANTNFALAGNKETGLWLE